MSALGFVLMLIELPLPFIIPEFVKFDFSEIPSLLTAYILGPVPGVIVCLIKNILKGVFFTTSGYIGELCNFILGCTLVIPAGMAFKKHKTPKMLFVWGLVGAAIMGVLSVPVNYYISYPVYTKLLPIETIIEMYEKILPDASKILGNTDGLLTCLVVFNAPFTFVKGAISVVISWLVAKRLYKTGFFNKF